jgi:hypothetical protein
VSDTLVCSLCAAPAVAVAPGSEPETCDLFLVTRGEPMRCFCLAHWLALHGVLAQRTGEAAT